MRNIKQTLLAAFTYNSLGVPIAAGILYPVPAVVERNDRRSPDELQFSFSRWECAVTMASAVVRLSRMRSDLVRRVAKWGSIEHQPGAA